MRKKSLFVYFTLFICLQISTVNATTVRLNEILASNSSVNSDSDGDYEDWIELYNYGSSPVNLQGWFLSDDYGETDMWEFPSVTIQPNGYLLVWASNKNRTSGELHTNFAISSSGEEVLLVNPQGNIVDELPPTPLIADVSIGRRGSDNTNWHYFRNPTPGGENTTTAYQGIASAPVFSREGGIHNSGFDLSLSTNESGASIFYTTDGSEPERNNTNGSQYNYSQHGSYNSTIRQRSYQTNQYSSSISISDRTGRGEPQYEIATHWEQEAVSPRQDPLTGTVVRARAYRDGYIPSEVVTHSYLITNNSYNIPVISIVLPEKYFFCYDEGIYVPGRTFEQWRQSNMQYGEWWQIPGHSPANFNMRGRDWERESNVELFEPNGNTAINQRAGVRIHGGWSRSFPHKSLRLYARGGYGESEFSYKFFPDKDTDTFKRILLRTSGNDYDATFFRDAMIQQMVKHRPIDMQHWQPSVTFVNGEYWGLLNIRDRVDRYFLHYKYGVDPDNLDILEAGNSENPFLAKQGDDQHYSEMFNYIRNNDMNNQNHFAHVKTMMDVGNFAEYFAINIFVNNKDWPGNNMDFWRLRTDEYKPNAPEGHDGRWRWILFDTDFGFGIWNSGPWENTLRHATGEERHDHGNPTWSTELFRNMLDSDEFKHVLINRFADLMNTSFDADSVNMKIDQMQEVYEPVIRDQIDRWNRIESRTSWVEEINKMKSFANERPGQVRSHVESYFGLSGNSRITLNPGTGSGTVRVNTIKFRNSQGWEGRYFRDVPIEIEAIPDFNYSFSHWEGDYSSQEELLEVVLSGSIELTAHFVEDRENPMVHYWHFNDLSSDEINSVNADISATGTGRISYSGSSQGYMDRVGGNLNNSRYNTPSGYGLRVRNPSDNRSLVIESPTTGYEHIVFSYAVERTSNGSQRQRVSYSPNGGSTWNVLGDNIRVNENYEVRVFDLRSISEVNNNSQLQFRIEFTGDNASLESGNNRFDNIVVEMLDPSIPVVDVITDVEKKVNYSWGLRVGPNPIRDELFVTLDNPKECNIGSSVKLVIKNLNQTKEKTDVFDITNIGKNISSKIDVSCLSSGVYIIELYLNGKRVDRGTFTKINLN